MQRKGVLAHLVGHFGNLDGAFGCGERLVAGQEGEALRLLAEQTGSQVAMADAHLAVVGYGAGDAECLQADADGLGSVGSILAALLDGDGRTYHVSPLGVLEANHLRVFASLIRIQTGLFANSVRLFDIFDAVLVQSSQNLLHTTVLTLKLHFSYHSLVPPYYSLRGSIALTIPCSGFVRPYVPVTDFKASSAGTPFFTASMNLPMCTNS